MVVTVEPPAGRSVLCSLEIILDELLDGSWVRTGHQKDQANIIRLEFSVPPPMLLRRERAEMELMIYHADVMKPS